jgi:peptide/nickel transport system ATP-binding protein
MTGDVVLEVKGLKTHFFVRDGVVRAVDGVDLEVRRGRTLCVVGESGCGKSATAHSILQLVQEPGRIVDGRILLHRTDGAGDSPAAAEVVDIAALDASSRAMREIRGMQIGMVFQEPMTSLSPVHTVGDQVTEPMLLHLGVDKREARERAVALLGRVGLPNPARHLDSYPFQLSGGMRQRVSIASALACEPALLIADEPTTALDVTTQAQILELLRELQDEMAMGIMFITHDLGVVATIADEVAVMYLGTVAERSNVDALFYDPKHPYTQALLASIPQPGSRRRGTKLQPVRGMVPSPYARPPGCPFHPRCDAFMPGLCDREDPPVVRLSGDHLVRCQLYGEEVRRGADELDRAADRS